jgi:hypothetical protein
MGIGTRQNMLASDAVLNETNVSLQELAANETELDKLRNVSQVAKEVSESVSAAPLQEIVNHTGPDAATTEATMAKPRPREDQPLMLAPATDRKASENASQENGTEPVAFGETRIVQAMENATATVIWAHGMGDSGEYFEDLPDTLGVPWCRFILPTARMQAVTVHSGIRQPAWFDISKYVARALTHTDSVTSAFVYMSRTCNAHNEPVSLMNRKINHAYRLDSTQHHQFFMFTIET